MSQPMPDPAPPPPEPETSGYWHDVPATRWGVIAVQNGIPGRGDWNAQELRRALDAGWEPFAVADGHIWLRKQERANA